MPSAHELSLELPATQQSPRAAREAVDSLPLSNDLEATFNLRLLVTELVTNSVRHAGLSPQDTITLDVWLAAGHVRVEVGDHGPGFPPPALRDLPSGTSGRGLFLVDALADRWGTDGDHGRSQVWFEIDL